MGKEAQRRTRQGWRSVADGYASLYPSYGLPGDMKQLISASINKKISVGRVKKRSDVPVRVSTLLLTGTLRFTRPTDYQVR
jgi:hypothetical protein